MQKKFRIAVGMHKGKPIYTNIISAANAEQAVRKYLNDAGYPYDEEAVQYYKEKTIEHIPKTRKS